MTSRQQQQYQQQHHRSKSSLSNKTDLDGLKQQQQHIQRPTSLHPLDDVKTIEGLRPEKEPIRFEVNLIGAPPEVEQLVNNIKHVAEQFLYHWKTFPIILPIPISQMDSIPSGCENNSLGRAKQKFHLRDLFLAPSFDELDAVAVDVKGETRKLSGKQLECIRERGLHKDKFGKPKRLSEEQLQNIKLNGEFEVDSINFPGQKHKWKLSQLLQKGRENARLSFLNDVALSLRFIFVTAKGRLVSQIFSVQSSALNLLKGLRRILDLLVGLPSLQAQNLEGKLREERCKYLVAELLCRRENEENLELLCTFIRKQLKRAATEKFEVTRECAQSPVAPPYKFLTPSGLDIDLRLWDRSLMRKAIPILISILERETRGWFLHFRERLITELRGKKMPEEKIEKEVNDAVTKEYLQRVFNGIKSNSDILNLGDGIGDLLVQQAQSVVLMYRAIESVQQRLSKNTEIHKTNICQSHPILSLVPSWLNSCLFEFEKKFIQLNEWSAHEEALNLCNQQRLLQTVYFLNRDLAFMREREPALMRELEKDKTPTRQFFWPTQIWLPKNWIVRRNFQGQSEVVPTVLSKQATSITTPRSDPSQPVFLVEKELIRTTTTRWPLWRIFNYFHRTWCWTFNAIFFFFIVIPWCSPIGIRSLLFLEPFMPDLELSQINGTLFPRKSSQTQTLWSRLKNLWRHISKSRTNFESKPDTGFIGKGFTRHVNRVFNYFVKGMFGTLALIVLFPLICLTLTTCSILIAITSILWMPILTLLVQISNMLIYDLDAPLKDKNRIFVIGEALIWNIFIQGLIQPIVAVFVAIVLCPVISFIIFTAGMFRYLMRHIWDTLTFNLLIKPRARIPSTDSIAVKRISGPGLTSDYFFQIEPSQSLAALHAKIESEELDAYQNQMENLIMEPQRDFQRFVEACFGWFSTQLNKSGGSGPYKVLEKEGQDLLGVLHEKLEKRRRDLVTGLSVGVRGKIKLSTQDLKIAIQQGAQMLERYYPNHIWPKLNCTEEQFWESKSLNQSDWVGLACLLYTEIFSYDFLTPLDGNDVTFRLDPHPNADLTFYTEIVRNAQRGSPTPDLLGQVYMPRGNIKVHSPHLDVIFFNPRSRFNQTGKNEKKIDTTLGNTTKPNSSNNQSNNDDVDDKKIFMLWKKKRCQHFHSEKLIIPLPIPHPAHIAVTIYNRDYSDDPIPLDSEICMSILRGIEDSHISPDDSGIGRFKGGSTDDYATTTTSSSSNTLNRRLSSSDIEERGGEGRDEEEEKREKEIERNNSTTLNQWTLTNWMVNNHQRERERKRKNSGSVRVDLASPEDVTLDSDSTRVVFCTYGSVNLYRSTNLEISTDNRELSCYQV